MSPAAYFFFSFILFFGGGVFRYAPDFRDVVAQCALGFDFRRRRLADGFEKFAPDFQGFGAVFCGCIENLCVALFGDVERVAQCGKLRRDSVEKPADYALYAFLRRDFLPDVEHGVGVFRLLFAEDVGVAADEFVGKLRGDVVEVEPSLFACDFAVQEYVH